MADHTITIANSVRAFGSRRANYWGVFEWGETWGTIVDFEHEVGKIVQNTITPASIQIKNFIKSAINNTLFIDSQPIKAPSFTLSFGSVNVTNDMSEMYLQDAAGYYRFFRGYTPNAKNRKFTTFSQISGIATTIYTEVAATSTSWSRV
jgi:hypothetical protein